VRLGGVQPVTNFRVSTPGSIQFSGTPLMGRKICLDQSHRK
jgi:hypothetical protein